MSLPMSPDPFPTLKEGLALGARDHRGFVNVWNWLCGIMRKAKDYFCLGLNNRTGDVSLIAGEGIDVTTEGNTIMISVGTGKNTDNDGGSGGNRGGGSSTGGGNGGGAGGGRGGGSDISSDWTNPATKPTPPSEPSTKCNDWSEGADNGWGEPKSDNEGDNCQELNGW
jgi:hypothetical protein